MGPKLEDQWSSFEDDVEKDNKDLYEKVEKYLDPTIAGSEAKTLDKEALGNFNDKLTIALKELQNKIINNTERDYLLVSFFDIGAHDAKWIYDNITFSRNYE